MKFAIERATARDAEEIGHLFDLYRRFYGQPADRAAAIAFLRDRLERDESVVFVARNDARGTIGIAQLYPLFCSVALKRQWLLYDLYVLPEARRTGVARGLLERCRELGIQTGSHALFLETASEWPTSAYRRRSLTEDAPFPRKHACVVTGTSWSSSEQARA